MQGVLVSCGAAYGRRRAERGREKGLSALARWNIAERVSKLRAWSRKEGHGLASKCAMLAMMSRYGSSSKLLGRVRGSIE